MDEIIQLNLQSCGILFLANQRVRLFIEFTSHGNLGIAEARSLQDQLRLQQKSVFAIEAGAREKHDPGNVTGMRSYQGRDHAAFAMTNEADFLWINFLASLQIGEGRLGVGGEALHRRVRVVSGGLAVSAFVEAQNGDAFSRQVIRKHQEGTMPSEGFVAVIWPGTAEQNSSGKRSLAARKSERARE